MGILSDMAIKQDVQIIPWADQQDRPGVISYGVTSYGYDARLGYKFKVFKPYPAEAIDPKAFNKGMLEDVELPDQSNSYIVIPPHSFVLGESLEYFEIPRHTLAIVLGKSTYARCGLIVNVTPLEPEWKGKVTIELSNTTPLPMKVYAGEGIMQVLFITSAGFTASVLQALMNDGTPLSPAVRKELARNLNSYGTCRTSYADKKGKYQDQAGLVLPIVKKDIKDGIVSRTEWGEWDPNNGKKKVTFCAWCPDPNNPSIEHHPMWQASHVSLEMARELESKEKTPVVPIKPLTKAELEDHIPYAQEVQEEQKPVPPVEIPRPKISHNWRGIDRSVVAFQCVACGMKAFNLLQRGNRHAMEIRYSECPGKAVE